MTRILLALVMVLAAALGWSLYRAEVHKLEATEATDAAESARAELADVRATLQAERQRAERMASIAVKTQQELDDAQVRAESLAADLVSGDRRVRHEIAALHTARLSADAATARELDAAAQRGSAYLASAVRVGRECDIVQRGLIEAYEVGRDNSRPEKR